MLVIRWPSAASKPRTSVRGYGVVRSLPVPSLTVGAWIKNNPGKFSYVRPGKGGFVGTRFVKQIFFEVSQLMYLHNCEIFGLNIAEKYPACL